MREILFRAKRVDTGEWVEGFYYQRPNPYAEDGEPITHCITNCPPFAFEVDPATVGQCTGLCDNHGKQIFEGDILEAGRKTRYRHIVRFGEFAPKELNEYLQAAGYGDMYIGRAKNGRFLH